MKISNLVTLTTDFGLRDWFVGVMKGRILAQNPDCTLIDITHEITPQSVNQAQLVVKMLHELFDAFAIHLVVVDPGVGSSRRPIIVKKKQGLYVGPDNGVFSPLYHDDFTCYEIKNFTPKSLSHTFHGRDIFAPVARELSMGKDPELFGPIISDPVELEIPAIEKEGQNIYGEILYADNFGNLITNIPGDYLEKAELLCSKTFEISTFCSSYAEGVPANLCAIKGSHGFIEIFLINGNAKKHSMLDLGNEIILILRSNDL